MSKAKFEAYAIHTIIRHLMCRLKTLRSILLYNLLMKCVVFVHRPFWGQNLKYVVIGCNPLDIYNQLVADVSHHYCFKCDWCTYT